MHTFFSIITCTYNPDMELLDRLKISIEKLNVPKDIKVEWLLVDNNSEPALRDKIRYNDLSNGIRLSIICEGNPGLTNARKKGVIMSKGDWLIFFDDDNEPNDDYLQNCVELIKNHSDVGIWGVGNISVKFTSQKVSPWVISKKEVFQERHFQKERISNDPNWESWYPIGTGLLANKKILLDYVAVLENEKYDVSDRKGKSLTSGGDMQIVLHGLKLGYNIGTSPSLKMNHWINSRKSTVKYLLRHAYWVRSTTKLTYDQVFPEMARGFKRIGNKQLFLIIYSVFRIYLVKEGLKEILYKISSRFGDCNAMYIAHPDKSRPFILNMWQKILA